MQDYFKHFLVSSFELFLYKYLYKTIAYIMNLRYTQLCVDYKFDCVFQISDNISFTGSPWTSITIIQVL